MSDPFGGHGDRRHRTVFRREPEFLLLLEIYDLFDPQRENWCQPIIGKNGVEPRCERQVKRGGPAAR